MDFLIIDYKKMKNRWIFKQVCFSFLFGKKPYFHWNRTFLNITVTICNA